MAAISSLIERLRLHDQITVVDQSEAWLLQIIRKDDSLCEIVIPHKNLEWFASLKHSESKKEIWTDWMDYSGYDTRPQTHLEAEMATDISEFVDRVLISEINLPLVIYKGNAQQDAAANP